MQTETPILRNVREAVNTARGTDGAYLGRLRRNHNGFDRRIATPYGLGAGSPDLVGIVRGGRAFALEVKTPVGSLEKDQKAWARSFIGWGGYWGRARSVAEALDHLARALAGEASVMP